MQKITPFLWFNDQAEEAVRFYTSVFRDSKMGTVSRYSDAGPGEPGSVMTAAFEIDGMEFVALNGGPIFTFNPAISFVIRCEDQDEVDYFWETLAAGGRHDQCGWLTDKFGVSWQVVPLALYDYVNGPDVAGSQRATQAMLKMGKLVIQELKAAYEGG